MSRRRARLLFEPALQPSSAFMDLDVPLNDWACNSSHAKRPQHHRTMLRPLWFRSAELGGRNGPSDNYRRDRFTPHYHM